PARRHPHTRPNPLNPSRNHSHHSLRHPRHRLPHNRRCLATQPTPMHNPTGRMALAIDVPLGAGPIAVQNQSCRGARIIGSAVAAE
ncbi:hypothetical protein H4S02_013603, partial [Coemansia sp. RSA 2611]